MPSFNGVHGRTGRPLFRTLGDEEFAQQIARQSGAEELWLRRVLWQAQLEIPEPHRRPVLSEHHDDLSQAGWALVVPEGVDTAREEAELDRLLRLRRDQTRGLCETRLVWPKKDTPHGRVAVTAEEFVSRHGAFLANPTQHDRVPYYLLLLASPDQIPFQEQSQLDPQYAVGRLWFDDPAGYRHYADTVADVEEGRIVKARKAVLFGAENGGDAATARLLTELLLPVAKRLREWYPNKIHEQAIFKQPWDVETVLGASADRAALLDLLGGRETPALLFTGTHGLGFESDDVDQRRHQGALVTSEWVRREQGEDVDSEVLPEAQRLGRELFVAGEDLRGAANLGGLITFLFGCYTGGCPRRDSYQPERIGLPDEIAPKPFVSALVQRLLGHPEGTALAVIAHVDRAWTTSFGWVGGDGQAAAFEDAAQLLIEGHRVGWATEVINQAYSSLSAYMHGIWCARDQLIPVAPNHFHRVYTATQDLGNFLLFGDPAVRAAVRG